MGIRAVGFNPTQFQMSPEPHYSDERVEMVARHVDRLIKKKETEHQTLSSGARMVRWLAADRQPCVIVIFEDPCELAGNPLDIFFIRGYTK